MQVLPLPVRKLYQLLCEASSLPVYDNRFAEEINRLSVEFHDYASFFPDPFRMLGRELAKFNNASRRYDLQSPAPAPNPAQRFLGSKFCRNTARHLARAYFWFHP
jgi:hypothetical protein